MDKGIFMGYKLKIKKSTKFLRSFILLATMKKSKVRK